MLQWKVDIKYVPSDPECDKEVHFCLVWGEKAALHNQKLNLSPIHVWSLTMMSEKVSISQLRN